MDDQLGTSIVEEVMDEEEIIKEVRKSLKKFKEKVMVPVAVTKVGGGAQASAAPTTVFQKDPNILLSTGVLSYKCTPAELKNGERISCISLWMGMIPHRRRWWGISNTSWMMNIGSLEC